MRFRHFKTASAFLLTALLAVAAFAPRARALPVINDPAQPRDEVIVVLESWKEQLRSAIEKNKKAWFGGDWFLSFPIPEYLHKYSGTFGLALSGLTEADPPPGTIHLGTIYVGSSKFSEAVRRIDWAEEYYKSQTTFCTSEPTNFRDGIKYRLEFRSNAGGLVSFQDEESHPSSCRFEGSVIYKNCKLANIQNKYGLWEWVVEHKGQRLFANTWKQTAYSQMLSTIACSGIPQAGGWSPDRDYDIKPAPKLTPAEANALNSMQYLVGDWYSHSKDLVFKFYKEDTSGRILMVECEPKTYKKSHFTHCDLGDSSSIIPVYDETANVFCLGGETRCASGVRLSPKDHDHLLYFKDPFGTKLGNLPDDSGTVLTRVTKGFRVGN